MIDFSLLANEGIRTLNPYQPGKPISEVERELGITSIIKLASNENPLGASPNAIHAAKKALTDIHLYPDASGYELKQALASFFSLQPVQITLGNGSENLLELLVKTFLNDENNAIISQYAFVAIPIILKSFNIQTKIIPAIHWGHDIKKIIDAIDDKTKMIFIVNPNNPTGTYTTAKDFEYLMNNVPKHILVISDEAYNEYIDRNDYPKTLNYLADFPNLVITKTFSKAYGLAGLRLGYALSSPVIADMLNRARLTFNVNSIALQAGVAALADQAHVQQSVKINQQGMQQIEKRLQQMKLFFIPSIANFITVNVNDAVKVSQQLLQEGIIVRPLQPYNLPEFIRITIGTQEQNDRFLTALAKILGIRT